MSANKHHIDLSRYSNLQSDEFLALSGEERELFRACTVFTEEATTHLVGQTIYSRLFCTNHQDERFCNGLIKVVWQEQPQQIRWECVECGKYGIITGFEGTKWDLRHLSPLEASHYLYEKYDFWKEMSDSEKETFINVLDWYESLNEEDSRRMESYYRSERPDDMQQERGSKYKSFPPEVIKALLDCNWENPNSVIYLRDDLPLDKLRDIVFFTNAREYLLQMMMEEGFELDERGYLKPKHVKLLLDELKWYDEYEDNEDFVESLYDMLDEREMNAMLKTRMMLERAGIIKEKENTCTVVKEKLYLLDEEQAGTLYQQVFCGYFSKIEWGTLGGGTTNFVSLQKQLSYTLYQLQKGANTWTTDRELMEKCISEEAANELLNVISLGFLTIPVMFYHTILKPLIWFGLLEARASDRLLLPEYDPPDEFKKTDLFDQFIKSNLNVE